jgi:AP-4 complex subunit mu-1
MKNFTGIQFFSVKRTNLYFVCTSRKNVSPIVIIEFMNRICQLIKDFTGNLSEQVIRNNIILIYEILDEVLDFGHIQTLKTRTLMPYIQSKPNDSNQRNFFFDTISNFSVSIIFISINSNFFKLIKIEKDL